MRTLRRPGSSGEIGRRLFCFPYAGAGSAAFRPWAELIPADVELCVAVPPGREARIDEPPLSDMAQLADMLADEIAARTDRPYALFGHSLGAFVALEAAHALARRGAPKPSHLLVSSQRGPSLPATAAPISELPEAEFLEGVAARYRPLPAALLADADFRRVVIRTMRADLSLVEGYHRLAADRLDCPIIAFGGLEDQLVDRASLEAWADETTASCRLCLLPGGHFFIDTARAELVALIAQALED